jgi:factor associated with neutral sphingomyelinase activation
VAKLLEPALELLAVSRLPQSEADEMLAAMARRREDNHTFDASRCRSDEQVVFDAPAAQISPLVREPGRLVVGLYKLTPPDPKLKGAWFQPLHLSSEEPVSKIAFQIQRAPLHGGDERAGVLPTLARRGGAVQAESSCDP